MKVEYINPFVASTRSVFATMLGCELTRGTPFSKEDRHPQHEVSGIIGLSGKARGTVVLSLERSVALAATAVLLGEHPKDINADVVDTVGELTNMIAGGAKAKLEELEMTVSLPSVITGKSHTVDFPSQAVGIGIPFESEWGALLVEVGLVEQQTEVPVAVVAAVS
ncbi:MAG: chemotaxis protein CheX [Candidatus Nealsonbacteria bacterium]|nr:chemotaxis protein CheX [Candidatus Nealsonbacteria bacterium]